LSLSENLIYSLNPRASTYQSRGPRLSLKESNISIGLYKDSQIKIPKLTSDEVNSEYYVNRRPIEFSYDLADLLISFISRNMYRDLRKVRISERIPHSVRYELKRFMCALEAYRQSPNYLIPINKLLLGLRDKEFASKLKDYRDEIFLRSVKSQHFETPDFIDLFGDIRITDIGQIFNYNYWFFWKEDLVDDLKYSEIPVSEISEDDKNLFKGTLYNLLKRIPKIDIIPPEEILISTSGSSTYSTKSKYVFEEKQWNNRFTKTPLVGKRCIIPVSPDNIRDTIILSVPHSNTVKWIEYQCREIAEKIRYSAYVRNDKDFNEIVDNLYQEYEFFLDRDIKKEGLTKPRELIHLTLEVLKDVYPNARAFEYGSIYDNFTVIHEDGSRVSYPRGHGLGMANALTTIIQSVIFEITKQDLIAEWGLKDYSMSAVIFNDDFTAGFKEEHHLDEFWDIEDLVLQRFSIIRNVKKSHKIKCGFTFCERYYPLQLNRKYSYKLAEFSYIFLQKNISCAKMYFNNLSRVLDDEVINKRLLLKEAVSYFGYEFFPKEWELPFHFGGWITPVFNNVDMSFIYNNKDYLSNQERAAFEASKVSFFYQESLEEDNTKYKSPLETIYPGEEFYIPEYFNMFINYGKSINEVNRLFLIRNNDQYLNKKFDHYKKQRNKIFLKFYNSDIIDIRDCYIQLNQLYLLKDFLPNKKFVIEKGFLTLNYYDEDNYVHPSTPTPLLSMVKYFNHTGVSNSIIPFYKNLIGYKYFMYKMTDEEYSSNEIFRLNNEINLEKLYSVDQLIIGEEFTKDSPYFNNNQVLQAYYSAYGKLVFPKMKFEVNRNCHFINKYPLTESFLSDKEDSRLLKILSKKVGFDKGYEMISSFRENPEIRYLFYQGIESHIKKQVPLIESDSEYSSDEEDERHYLPDEYVKWENDGSPMDITSKNLELFMNIKLIRDANRYLGDYLTQSSRETIPLEVIEYVLQREYIIRISGGEIISNPDMFNIYFSSIDHVESEGSLTGEEFDIFDI